jgi:cell wall-associated NlpC family hydrolase
VTVQDFLNTYQNSMLNKKIINPLSSTNTAVANSKLGISNPKRNATPTTLLGSKVPDWINSRKSSALDSYMQSKSNTTTELAGDYANKAAGQVPVDKYGIVQDKITDVGQFFNDQLSSIGNIGKASLATEESKAQWQTLQSQAEANAGYSVNWAPGASKDNPGAKAVSLAMTAVQNGTPYVWGGNSLTGGVDCSGLTQQIYKQLGINIPRSTYEQAKSGKEVGMGSLLPGDLVFYNTGSADPNGIGSMSHVAIYIGNGQVIEAPGRGKNVRVGPINSAGQPARAVRPW